LLSSSSLCYVAVAAAAEVAAAEMQTVRTMTRDQKADFAAWLTVTVEPGNDGK
jgi:hypothetical protein